MYIYLSLREATREVLFLVVRPLNLSIIIDWKQKKSFTKSFFFLVVRTLHLIAILFFLHYFKV